MNLTEIHTGLYSTKALDTIKHLFGAALNNLPYGVHRLTLDSIDIKRTPDGEIIFTCDENHNYRLVKIWRHCASNIDALHRIAIIIKSFTKRIGGEHLNWSRSNTSQKVTVSIDPTSYVLNDKQLTYGSSKSARDISVRDIYFLYDKFMNRFNIDKKYDKDFIDKFIGKPNDPITTELEIARNEELESVSMAYDVKIDELEAEYDHKINELRNDFYKQEDVISNECNRKIADLKAEMEAKIAKINKKYDRFRHAS